MKELRIYHSREGKEPFTKWLESLKDITARAQIANRLERAIYGNYGDCDFVGSDIYELMIHYGPGYRV